MNNEINLVSSDLGGISRDARRLSKFKTIATSAIFIIGILSVVLFLLNRLFSPDSIIKQQDATLVSISALQTRQTKIVMLNQRLNDISAIIKKRQNYDIVLNEVFNKFSGNVSITSLSVDKKKISMIVLSSSLLSVSDFIDVLKGMVEKKQFLKSVIVNGLTLNSKDGYFLTLEMDLL